MESYLNSVNINPKKIFIWQLRLIFLLFIFHVISVILKFYAGNSKMIGLAIKIIEYLFNFNFEKNIPTFYSAIAILCSSILLFYIATMEKHRNSKYLHWLVLSIIFFFLSIDEIASIHEHFSILMKNNNFEATGLFYRAWIIPYGIATCIFCIFYLRFLINLQRNFRYLFLLSGAIFICGALGLEMLGGAYIEINSGKNLTYSIISTFEELLEMLGISLFLFTLLSYIVTEHNSIIISLSDKKY